MWKLISKYETHGIKAAAYRAKRDKIKGQYDLGIFFSSYESRCLVSTTLLAHKSCKAVIVVLFKNAKNNALRKTNDPILIEQATKCSHRKPIILKDLPVREVSENLAKILSR